MEIKKNSWICDHENIVLKTPIMDLTLRSCHSSEDENRKYEFYTLRSHDWCNIIPVTEDGKIVLVKQFRIGIDKHTLEVPGGVTDLKDHNIMKTALRELAEETGYSPLPGAQCIPLGWTFPNPAILNNKCYSFAVGPVAKSSSQELDPGEMIEVLEVPIEKIPEMLTQGEIDHALMLNTFFLLALRSKKLAHGLVDELNQLTRVTST